MTTLPEIKELLVQIRDDQRRLVKLAEGFCKLQLHLMRLQTWADELDPGVPTRPTRFFKASSIIGPGRRSAGREIGKLTPAIHHSEFGLKR